MVRDFLKFNSLEKRLLALLTGATIFMMVLYGYFIDQTVSNIAERRNVGREMAMLNTTLGTLELEYSKLQENISRSTALSLGFRESGEALFVVRANQDTLLTLSNWDL